MAKNKVREERRRVVKNKNKECESPFLSISKAIMP